jgi:RNA polymerase sigma-70 factor, ECF subfamily
MIHLFQVYDLLVDENCFKIYPNHKILTEVIPFLEGFFLILALSADKSLDDHTLATAIRNGDNEAFRSFFDRHYPALYRFMASRGMDHDDVQDLIQKAFLTIWEKRDGIDSTKSLRAFLFRIAYNSMLNHIAYHSKFEDAEFPEFNRDIAGPGNETDHSELLRHINRIVAEMPEKRQMVFQLCFMKQFTYREAAGILEVTVKTVENHMGMAFKELRNKLGKVYSDGFFDVEA